MFNVNPKKVAMEIVDELEEREDRSEIEWTQFRDKTQADNYINFIRPYFEKDFTLVSRPCYNGYMVWAQRV
jgi:hypothetical protein